MAPCGAPQWRRRGVSSPHTHPVLPSAARQASVAPPPAQIPAECAAWRCVGEACCAAAGRAAAALYAGRGRRPAVAPGDACSRRPPGGGAGMQRGGRTREQLWGAAPNHVAAHRSQERRPQRRPLHKGRRGGRCTRAAGAGPGRLTAAASPQPAYNVPFVHISAKQRRKNTPRVWHAQKNSLHVSDDVVMSRGRQGGSGQACGRPRRACLPPAVCVQCVCAVQKAEADAGAAHAGCGAVKACASACASHCAAFTGPRRHGGGRPPAVSGKHSRRRHYQGGAQPRNKRGKQQCTETHSGGTVGALASTGSGE